MVRTYRYRNNEEQLQSQSYSNNLVTTAFPVGRARYVVTCFELEIA